MLCNLAKKLATGKRIVGIRRGQMKMENNNGELKGPIWQHFDSKITT